MARTWMIAALFAAALAWATPAISWACSMEKPGEPCPCKHHQKADAKATPATDKTPSDQKAPAPKPEPASTEKQGHTGLLAPMHSQEIAAKCTCGSPADCTCKKGTCKCPKCGKRHEGRVVEPLNGTRDALRLPATARSDASAGMFI